MKKAAGIFFFTFLLLQTAMGQVPFFQKYYLLKKNEPVQVNVIFQDKTGLIWLGTNRGLFKFDGITYRQFHVFDNLPDENVTALAEDSLGRIWTGHKNGKLAFFEKNQFHAFEPPEGSAAHEISDILFDQKGNLWFSTLNDGLYYFIQGRLYRLDEQEGMPDLFVYDIEEDRHGNVWAGTDGGVAVCSLTDSKVSLTVLDDHHGLPDNIVKKLVSGAGDTMWMGTEDAGVIQYDPATRKFKPMTRGRWDYGAVTDFAMNENQIWISSQQNGLMVYERQADHLKFYNSTTGQGFASITTLLRDQEGNIWAGSKTGVMRTLGDQLEYIEIADPSKDANVVSLAVDHQGNVWFSNSEGLFKRHVDENGRVTTEQQLVRTPFQFYTVISLFVDSAGYVWAGLYGEGAVRINPLTGKFTYLRRELRNGNVLNITGKGNLVWLATLGGGTQIRIDKEKLTVKNYSSKDGLSTDFIYQVFIDSQDRVWFATDGKGVDRLDKDGFHHFEKGLNSKVVYGFAEDRDHRIWVNAQADGLYRLAGDTFQPVENETPLRDNIVNGFTSDQFGNLIVMHDLGIDKVDIKKNKVRFLADEAGIHNKKANLNAVAKDDRGHIFFGTDGGIIKYSDIVHEGVTSPQPVINSLTVFDQPIDFSQGPRLSYDENNITIGYSGLWFQDPENLNFQYKLENYDREWIDRRDHSVTYSSLPPGTYTFQLKVSESVDFEDAKVAMIQFVISPPFWRTAWFYGLCIVVIIFLGYSFIQYRERKLQDDKRILEARVRQRTLEIQRKTEEIQVQNEEIHAQTEEIKGINENLEMLVKARTRELEKKNKSLEEYAFISAHELRAPVASILGLINLMRTVTLKPEVKIYLEHLEKSADKLDNVCNSITRAIEKGDL